MSKDADNKLLNTSAMNGFSKGLSGGTRSQFYTLDYIVMESVFIGLGVFCSFV